MCNDQQQLLVALALHADDDASSRSSQVFDFPDSKEVLAKHSVSVPDLRNEILPSVEAQGPHDLPRHVENSASSSPSAVRSRWEAHQVVNESDGSAEEPDLIDTIMKLSNALLDEVDVCFSLICDEEFEERRSMVKCIRTLTTECVASVVDDAATSSTLEALVENDADKIIPASLVSGDVDCKPQAPQNINPTIPSAHPHRIVTHVLHSSSHIVRDENSLFTTSVMTPVQLAQLLLHMTSLRAKVVQDKDARGKMISISEKKSPSQQDTPTRSRDLTLNYSLPQKLTSNPPRYFQMNGRQGTDIELTSSSADRVLLAASIARSFKPRQ